MNDRFIKKFRRIIKSFTSYHIQLKIARSDELTSRVYGKRQFHVWRSSKAEIVIVDVFDSWERFDDANHGQVR